MPFSPFSQWVGIAREAVRGTALPPAVWIPVQSPAYNPNLMQIEDKAMRGSMVTVNDLIPGIRDDELDFSSYLYTDTIGNIFMGLLGSPDVSAGTASGGADTLAAASTGGTNTISTTATHAANVVLQLDTGVSGKSELVTVQSVTGSGPFNITLTSNALFSHSNGATVQPVVAPFSHTFSLLNNSTATGNQPPSYTWTYFNGNNARQAPSGQFDSCNFTFNPTGIVEYKGKILGQAAPTAGPYTPAPTAVAAIPSYNAVVKLAGTTIAQMADGTLDIKRGTKPVTTVGNTTPSNVSPYRIWAGPCDVTGKMSLVMEDDTFLLDYLNSSKPSLDIVWSNVFNTDTVEFHMTNAMFKTGKPQGGKEVMQVDVDYVAKPNTTDATAGGNSPIKITLTNSQSTVY